MPVAFAGTAVLQEVADGQQIQAMARPAGAQTGDLLVLAYRAQNRYAELGNDPQVSGFSRVTAWTTGGGARPTMLFARRITAIGSEADSYDVRPTGGGFLGGRRALALFLLRGARVNAPAAAVSPGENGSDATSEEHRRARTTTSGPRGDSAKATHLRIIAKLSVSSLSAVGEYEKVTGLRTRGPAHGLDLLTICYFLEHGGACESYGHCHIQSCTAGTPATSAT
jgi:hypothetical protein